MTSGLETQFELCLVKHFKLHGRESCYVSTLLSIIYSMNSFEIDFTYETLWYVLLEDLYKNAQKAHIPNGSNILLYSDSKMIGKILSIHPALARGDALIKNTLQMLNAEIKASVYNFRIIILFQEDFKYFSPRKMKKRVFTCSMLYCRQRSIVLGEMFRLVI